MRQYLFNDFSNFSNFNVIDYDNELLYWIKIGNYINKTDKLYCLSFLYKQCKLHH